MLHRTITLFVSVLLVGLMPVGATSVRSAPVYLVRITGAITPANAGFLKKAVQRAEDGNAGCLIVTLDTPGGLSDAMREMVMTIYDSRVPVVVYVAPSGARAASAGVMITMAADVAAMAPGTHIGAAHPVGAGGQSMDDTMAEKVTNDMVAFVRSIAERRGRNLQWAEKAVRESVSVTETEALDKGIVDRVATDLDDLIGQLNGVAIQGKGRMDLDPTDRVWIDESFQTRILKVLSDPNIAYILMMIGLAGLYFELSHPGVILPGVIGSIALILAFYSFQTLPVNTAGVLLILLAVIFFIMEMKITSFGLLSVAGVVSLLLGSVMLFERANGGPDLAWSVMIPTICLVGGFFAVVAGLVFRSRRRPPMTGDSGLIGSIGVVQTALAPRGRVRVRGELWFARCRIPLAPGKTVRVTAVDGLTLEVEPE